VNKEVAYMKTLRCANKILIIDLRRYLDRFKYNPFNEMKEL